MGFLRTWNAPRRGVYADSGRQGAPAPWDGFWYDKLSGFMSAAGTTVSGDTALTIPPFWRAVRILSENIASFKCRVYERKDRGHAPAPNHPYASTLAISANPDLTAFEFWEAIVAHLVVRSRAFAFKRFVSDPRRGRERLELWPLHPDRVEVVRTPNLVLQYKVRTVNVGEPPKIFGTDQIFHIRGMSFDGIDGAPMMSYARNSIGGMLGAEGFAQRFFKSGVSAALAVVHPESLGEEGLDNLRKGIQAYIGGLENAYGILALDEKVDLKPIGVEPEKAQLLATREFTGKQVANWIGLPPGMLGETDTPTYASSEQFREDLVDLTFRTLAERLEARIDHDVLEGAPESIDDPGRYFAEFDLGALQRGTRVQRYQSHETAIRAGWKTRNEVRLEENMETLTGLDEPIVALNMGNTGGNDPSAPPRGRGKPDASGERQIRAEAIVLQEATHLVRAELEGVRKLAARHAADGDAWKTGLVEFYGKHAERVAERLRLPIGIAREYAGRQGLRLTERGIATAEDWERVIPAELAAAALDPEAVAGRLAAPAPTEIVS